MNVSIVFSFILVLIVIGVLLFFGADFISQLFCFAGDAQFIDNAKGIHELVCGNEQCTAGLLWNPGSSEQKTFPKLSCFVKICFVDPASNLRVSTETWEGDNADANIEIRAKNYTIYGLKTAGENMGYKVPNLKSKENFCIEEKTKLIFTYKGSYVEVSKEV